MIAQNISFYAWHMRLNLARALRDNGYEVIFVSSSDKSISTDKSSTGDIYSQKIEEEFAYYDIDLSRKGTNPLTDLKTIYQFYQLYKTIKPDVVLHYTAKPNIYGTIAASLLHIPIINNIAGLGTLFNQQNFVTKIAKSLYKFSQKKASKIFFQNSDDLELFSNDQLVERAKCDVLPGSGVDIVKFAPMDKTHRNKIRFLHISRMIWEKGIGEYVEAARAIKKKHDNVEFCLLGFLDPENPHAISEEQMNHWVEEGVVNYLGESDNVQEVIATANCVVLPSYYREGTPRTLLESACMAKPIITTNNVGCKDVVDDGVNGYLCAIKDAKDLEDKFEKMINLSDEQRAKMGQKGREKIIKEFDEKIVFNKYIAAIKEIL